MKRSLHFYIVYLLIVALPWVCLAADPLHTDLQGSDTEDEVTQLFENSILDNAHPKEEHLHYVDLDPSNLEDQDDQLDHLYGDDVSDENEDVDENESDDSADFDVFLYDLSRSLRAEVTFRIQLGEDEQYQEEDGDDIGEEEISLDDDDEETTPEFRNLYHGDGFTWPSSEALEEITPPAWHPSKEATVEPAPVYNMEYAKWYWRAFLIVVGLFLFYKAHQSQKTRQVTYTGTQEWRRDFKLKIDSDRLPLFRQDLQHSPRLPYPGQ